VDIVGEEIERLRAGWGSVIGESRLSSVLGEAEIAAIDLFDRVQLDFVLDVCGRSRSLSEAGRTLFSASRGRKTTTNDADRLKKYLARFGVEWSRISKE
jgi:transcriptional regulatory protein RtcR